MDSASQAPHDSPEIPRGLQRRLSLVNPKDLPSQASDLCLQKSSSTTPQLPWTPVDGIDAASGTSQSQSSNALGDDQLNSFQANRGSSRNRHVLDVRTITSTERCTDPQSGFRAANQDSPGLPSERNDSDTESCWSYTDIEDTDRQLSNMQYTTSELRAQLEVKEVKMQELQKEKSEQQRINLTLREDCRLKDKKIKALKESVKSHRSIEDAITAENTSMLEKYLKCNAEIMQAITSRGILRRYSFSSTSESPSMPNMAPWYESVMSVIHAYDKQSERIANLEAKTKEFDRIHVEHEEMHDRLIKIDIEWTSKLTDKENEMASKSLAKKEELKEGVRAVASLHARVLTQMKQAYMNSTATLRAHNVLLRAHNAHDPEIVEGAYGPMTLAHAFLEAADRAKVLEEQLEKLVFEHSRRMVKLTGQSTDNDLIALDTCSKDIAESNHLSDNELQKIDADEETIIEFLSAIIDERDAEKQFNISMPVAASLLRSPYPQNSYKSMFARLKQANGELYRLRAFETTIRKLAQKAIGDFGMDSYDPTIIFSMITAKYEDLRRKLRQLGELLKCDICPKRTARDIEVMFDCSTNILNELTKHHQHGKLTTESLNNLQGYQDSIREAVRGAHENSVESQNTIFNRRLRKHIGELEKERDDLLEILLVMLNRHDRVYDFEHEHLSKYSGTGGLGDLILLTEDEYHKLAVITSASAKWSNRFLDQFLGYSHVDYLLASFNHFAVRLIRLQGHPPTQNQKTGALDSNGEELRALEKRYQDLYHQLSEIETEEVVDRFQNLQKIHALLDNSLSSDVTCSEIETIPSSIRATARAEKSEKKNEIATTGDLCCRHVKWGELPKPMEIEGKEEDEKKSREVRWKIWNQEMGDKLKSMSQAVAESTKDPKEDVKVSGSESKPLNQISSAQLLEGQEEETRNLEAERSMSERSDHIVLNVCRKTLEVMKAEEKKHERTEDEESKDEIFDNAETMLGEDDPYNPDELEELSDPQELRRSRRIQEDSK